MPTLDLRTEAKKRAPVVADVPSLREAGIATWRGRMINEYTSSTVFAGLAEQLAALGARARARHVFQQPAQLGGGKIGVEDQSGAFLNHLRRPVRT